MIVSLAIAWCLLSVPFGIVLGMCMREGVHGDAVARRRAHAAAPRGGLSPAAEQVEGQGQPEPDVPEQRRAPARSRRVLDVS